MVSASPVGLPHTSVFLRESLAALAPTPDGFYIDGTFGRGGHTRALLERLGPRGRVLALDRDPDAIREAHRLAHRDPRLTPVQAPFSQVNEIAGSFGALGRVSGILLDLGVSSPQLDDPKRGFGFSQSGPLDMRMDPQRGETAAQWLRRASEREIARVLWAYGEERYARRIARALVRARTRSPLQTTDQLAQLVAAAYPKEPNRRTRRIHPATRTFQAIRIHLNGELDELRGVLNGLCTLLAPGGRLVVISFHSLEDRLVKRFIREESQGPWIPPGVPIPAAQRPTGRLRPLGKAQRPSEEEIRNNPRARSAILRAAERLP